MTKRIALLPLLAAGALAGCDFAPHDARPTAGTLPPQWPAGNAYPTPAPAAALGWRAIAPDVRLQAVIATALTANRSLQATLAAVEQARAQYRVQRASLLPTLSGTASSTIYHQNGNTGTISNTGTGSTGTGSTGTGSTGSGTIGGGGGAIGGAGSIGAGTIATGGGTYHQYNTNIGFSTFEIDLFGTQRNLTRAAFETYLASAEGARSARITLVAEVANAWVTLASDRELLTVAQETIASANTSLALTQELDRAGLISRLDVNEAATVVAQARSDIATYTTRVAQDRNALELLAGGPVAETDLPRGLADADRSIVAPGAGLSSEVLLRRPDVVQTEHQLRAANASIGAARAAFFPTINLTAAAGLASTALSNLFTGGAFNWTVAPSASVPLVGGTRFGNLAYARATRDAAQANYENAIQGAFRDVANALARRGTINVQRDAQAQLVAANRNSLLLSDAQYRAGISAYLNTLTAQRSLYTARQTEAATILEDLSNRVTLYSALGNDDPQPAVH